MEFVHYAANVEGEVLQNVAEVYVSDRFDIHGKAVPSASLQSLIDSPEVPEALRDVFHDVLTREK